MNLFFPDFLKQLINCSLILSNPFVNSSVAFNHALWIISLCVSPPLDRSLPCVQAIFPQGNFHRMTLCSVDNYSQTQWIVFKVAGSPSARHLITSTGMLPSHETVLWGIGSPPLPEIPLSIYKYRSSVSQVLGLANLKALLPLGQKLPTLMGSSCHMVECLLS